MSLFVVITRLFARSLSEISRTHPHWKGPPIYTPDPTLKILKIPNKTEPSTIIFTPFSSPFTRLLTYTQKK